MGRPRGYDEEAALLAAMQLFWDKGYEQTSVGDLVAATNASRASLYATWGDKQALYVAALEAYAGQVATMALATLEEGEPLAAIRRYVEQLADLVAHGRGCLVVDTVMQPVGARSEVATVTRAQLDRVQQALAAALRRAEVDEPEARAHHLAIALQGLLVQARARPGRDAIDAYVRFTLSTLPESP